jgi:hypothetical protein
MQQQENTPLDRIERQLERLDERVRDVVTRSDLEALRREVVQRDLLEPQLTLLKTQIQQIDTARIADKLAIEKRLDDMEKEQVSRSERLWTRLGPAIAAMAFLLALFEFISHLKFTP